MKSVRLWQNCFQEHLPCFSTSPLSEPNVMRLLKPAGTELQDQMKMEALIKFTVRRVRVHQRRQKKYLYRIEGGEKQIN